VVPVDPATFSKVPCGSGMGDGSSEGDETPQFENTLDLDQGKELSRQRTGASECGTTTVPDSDSDTMEPDTVSKCASSRMMQLDSDTSDVASADDGCSPTTSPTTSATAAFAATTAAASAAMLPEGGNFAEVLRFMLQYRNVATPPPPELESLSAQIVAPPAPPTPPASPPAAAIRTGAWKAERTIGSARQQASRSPEEDKKRTIQALLNKVCPENVTAIAEKVGAVEVHTPKDLEILMELIFRKALAEPHYCESYADLVFALGWVLPEFPSLDDFPITFRSILLSLCQAEFEEALSTSVEPTDGEGDSQELRTKKRKDRMLAQVKFMGHLFLRETLTTDIVGWLLYSMVWSGIPDVLPHEHSVECACELLYAIGFTLDSMPESWQAVEEVCTQLSELKSARTPDGRAAYCKRLQFAIQDLLDTRAAGWAKKQFKSSAKTKEEIRMEQEWDSVARQWGGEPSTGAEVVVAGMWPAYMSPAMAFAA